MNLVMVLLLAPLALAAVVTALTPGSQPRHRGRRAPGAARPTGAAPRHRLG
ncbi:hypothetical protein AB0D08_25695 [Kitasatospora sp. NPDC048540]|uniref:hypothetical protein n=1 Tax=unclassified Kitasatospora TaxID=2633591 RepID=UPI000ABFBAD6|nr:hypothetical protein [Kitasatospora sp. MBT63]